MDHRGPEKRCPADIFHPLGAGKDPTVPAFKQTEDWGVGYPFKIESDSGIIESDRRPLSDGGCA
jgi:hypothetical protein